MRYVVIAGLLIACGKSPTVDKPTENGSGSMNKTANRGPAATFEKGASLSPADKLVTWLESQKLDGKPRLLRLPIVIARGQLGFDTSKVKIGTGADALDIYVNDAALGEGLADRAETKCGDAPTCAFRVEGYWRGKQAAGLQLDVNKAEPLSAEALAGATFAEVEGESGN